MKTSRSLLISVVFLCTLLGLIGCSSKSNTEKSHSSSESEEIIKLKLATFIASTSPLATDFTEPWMERVTELTNGKVKFDYYPSEQLGKAADLFDLTGDNVTDISLFTPQYAPDKMALNNMLSSLPNLSTSVQQGTMAYNDLLHQNTDFLEKDFLNHNVRPIMGMVPPADDIWTVDKEIRIPDDLEGVKIRSKGGIANEIFDYLGAIPVTIQFPETYEALDRGVVEGTANYALTIQNGGFDELLNYSTPTQIGATVNVLIINENVWKKLPVDVQKAMTQAAEEIYKDIGNVYAEAISNFNQGFIESGGTILELTEEEKQQWDTKLEEWVQLWLEENQSKDIPYRETLEDYRELLKKYE